MKERWGRDGEKCDVFLPLSLFLKTIQANNYPEFVISDMLNLSVHTPCKLHLCLCTDKYLYFMCIQSSLHLNVSLPVSPQAMKKKMHTLTNTHSHAHTPSHEGMRHVAQCVKPV